MKNKNNLAYILLVLTTLFWSGNFIVGKAASIYEIPPFSLNFYRWLFAGLILLPFTLTEILKKKNYILENLGFFIILGITSITIFNSTVYYSLYYMQVISGVLMISTIPVWIMFISSILGIEKTNKFQILGVILSLLGVFFIITKSDIEVIKNLAFNRGDLIMLVACLMYSYYTLSLKTRLQIPGIAFFTLMSVIANFLALPLFIIDYLLNGINYPSINGLIITMLVAIFPSSLAQIFYLRAVDIAGPGKAGIYTNIVPIFSSVLAVILLNQSFEIFHGISLVLVLFGIWLSERQ